MDILEIGEAVPDSVLEFLSREEASGRVSAVRHCMNQADIDAANWLCGKGQENGVVYRLLHFHHHPHGVWGRVMEIQKK
ncbi:hypothetical protein GW793_02755 [bacterium]|uniref:Uncharacterized protein n=2 Tax=Katanobacteria TaxID=422282 RepID=A0A2M7X3G0_UNCKA|nr:hypothetical protein [bacterium]PIP56275.1 MAG: hypothetical protein COX05_04015 [candidate division WWE3 bacterium CG22_combo_CG10-13_8_21_14_all_39_12]PJA40712.1 MAG: hypothetical protein CO179_01535 [candidate division WWE3 bacterium CG_4_9_14_3_um_filter_39_7]